MASYSVLVSDEYESQHKQSFNRVYTVGIAVHQAGTHLSTGTHLHTFQRRKQISSHHRGESLPLSLQLRVTVHEKTHLCDRSTHSCTLAALLRMIWIKQEEDGNKSEGWVLSAWDGAFFVPDIWTLSIGQHWESSVKRPLGTNQHDPAGHNKYRQTKQMVCQSTSNSYSHHYSAATRTLISCSDGKISHTAASALVSTKATQLSTTT